MKDEMKSETKRDDILRTDGTGRNEIELRDDDTKTGRDGTGREECRLRNNTKTGRDRKKTDLEKKPKRDGTGRNERRY